MLLSGSSSVQYIGRVRAAFLRVVLIVLFAIAVLSLSGDADILPRISAPRSSASTRDTTRRNMMI